MLGPIQVHRFTGGAIAAWGLYGLVTGVCYGISRRDSAWILVGVLIGTGLPIGTALFRAAPRALTFARIYLSFIAVSSGIAIVLYITGLTPPLMRIGVLQEGVYLAVAVVLFLLLRFHGGARVDPGKGTEPGTPL